MVLPHESYIEKLAFTLGGCPIWGSLHPQLDPVNIADVGYLSESDGGWIKLFNLRSETDSKKLPSNIQLGSIVITNQDIECGVFKGPRYSNSIRKLGGSIDIQGTAEAGPAYERAEEKGAILFVAEDAVVRNALKKGHFIKLIQDNIENWMEFSKNEGFDVRMGDLVLVTGYVRTTTWAAAIFKQKSQWCKFTVGGEPPIEEANLELWGSFDVNASAWTGGPEGKMKASGLITTRFLKRVTPNIPPPPLLCKDDPRHQCVLIRGYRMASRDWQGLLPFKKKKLLEGIEVLNWKGSSDSVEVIPSPWDVLLEYLLRTEKKAKYAIIHDDDFSVLPTDVKSTSELKGQLKVLRPRVYLNGSVAMLKPTALEFFRSTGYFCKTDSEGLMAYFSKSTPSTQVGYFGSDSSFHNTFSDYQENPEILFASLKKIYIHAKTYIHSIQCEYQGPEKKILLGNKHGNSGEAPLYVFELNADEYIVKVRGRSGEYIEQLRFLTNKGRVSSIYGGSGGKPFVWIVDKKRYPSSPGLHHFEGTW
ncbi:hypothetical protein Clacol_010454 [Clathrus columnatus]|uniref:Jacalin-type lectin domain-containing protein n=1 Tax=Clathrus columnatus TaxID=1419009 RepID=A0AAV5ASP5_9AGAM|nr:hypothetical protein Clacol_010454 [Clathrus columnatus]